MSGPRSGQQPKRTVVTGELVGIDDSYPREVAVPRHLVLGVLAVGSFFRAVVAAFRHGGGGYRGWKDLKKGPEYLVTPIRVRDDRGRLVELEIHGYLSVNAVQRGDHIRARVRRQGDPELPPRVHHLANLTTGQVFEPKGPTLWSHLGPDLMVQATLGLVLAILVGLCLWAALA